MNEWSNDIATDGTYVVARFFANIIGLGWIVDILYYAKQQADANIFIKTFNWILYTFGGGFILTAITGFFTSIGLGWISAITSPLLLYAGWVEFGNYMVHYWDVVFQMCIVLIPVPKYLLYVYVMRVKPEWTWGDAIDLNPDTLDWNLFIDVLAAVVGLLWSLFISSFGLG